MKKLKPLDLKGFTANEHEPYTDYNQEIIDWLKDNAEVSNSINAKRKYIFTQVDNFYTHDACFNTDKYYTNAQFMERIGMINKSNEEFDSLLEQAHSLVKQIEKLWNKAKSQIDTKQENIRKELEFAEAKKQRLENHINILKSKLN
jgi:ABC-type transporter Mla subunit MlaD